MQKIQINDVKQQVFCRYTLFGSYDKTLDWDYTI